MRHSVPFGISSLAVWLPGPVVKSGAFSTLLLLMAGISLFTTTVVLWMPDETPKPHVA